VPGKRPFWGAIRATCTIPRGGLNQMRQPPTFDSTIRYTLTQLSGSLDPTFLMLSRPLAQRPSGDSPPVTSTTS